MLTLTVVSNMLKSFVANFVVPEQTKLKLSANLSEKDIEHVQDFRAQKEDEPADVTALLCLATLTNALSLAAPPWPLPTTPVNVFEWKVVGFCRSLGISSYIITFSFISMEHCEIVFVPVSLPKPVPSFGTSWTAAIKTVQPCWEDLGSTCLSFCVCNCL